MDSQKTVTVISSRLIAFLSATKDEITIEIQPFSVKNYTRAVTKFIYHTSKFDDDDYVRSLPPNHESKYMLYVDRILNFIDNFEDIHYRKNAIPKKYLHDAARIEEDIYSNFDYGCTALAPFTIKRADFESLLPEISRVKLHMPTNNLKFYLAYIECEAIQLARMALKFENLW